MSCWCGGIYETVKSFSFKIILEFKTVRHYVGKSLSTSSCLIIIKLFRLNVGKSLSTSSCLRIKIVPESMLASPLLQILLLKDQTLLVKWTIHPSLIVFEPTRFVWKEFDFNPDCFVAVVFILFIFSNDCCLFCCFLPFVVSFCTCFTLWTSLCTGMLLEIKIIS